MLMSCQSVLTERLPLTVALIKSIRQGSFCDRRYLTKQENTGKRRVPLYFSSIFLGGMESALNTRKRFLHTNVSHFV